MLIALGPTFEPVPVRPLLDPSSRQAGRGYLEESDQVIHQS